MMTSCGGVFSENRRFGFFAPLRFPRT